MEATQIRKVHCFFEQSGTFKREFERLGISAEDYDIQNNFGQTDNVVDLFGEIENAYTALTTRHDTTRHDTTRHDTNNFRQNRPLSRSCYGVLSVYLF